MDEAIYERVSKRVNEDQVRRMQDENDRLCNVTREEFNALLTVVDQVLTVLEKNTDTLETIVQALKGKK